VQFLPNQFIEKTTRLPLPEDRLSAVEWGHDAPCLYLLKGFSMLVLSRTVNQEIMIGDSIRVMVIEIRGDKVRLGITAPRDVPVHRHEIYETIKRDAIDTTDNDCD
jgi:carbon storage regulator